MKSPELVPTVRNYFGNVRAYAAIVRETITTLDYDEYLQEHKTPRSRCPYSTTGGRRSP